MYGAFSLVSSWLSAGTLVMSFTTYVHHLSLLSRLSPASADPLEIYFWQFFIGRPLNPTIPGFPSFDIKTFNEVRPGMILWLLLNISCACEQYVRIGKLTDSMWIVLVFEGWYVLDCLLQEVSPSPLLFPSHPRC